MKNVDAIRAKLYPYELPEDTLNLLLSEQGLEGSDDYLPLTNKFQLLQAVISALYQLVTLTKEKDNGSEVQYDVDSIWVLINRYENESKPESKRSGNRDITHLWG